MKVSYNNLNKQFCAEVRLKSLKTSTKLVNKI